MLCTQQSEGRCVSLFIGNAPLHDISAQLRYLHRLVTPATNRSLGRLSVCIAHLRDAG